MSLRQLAVAANAAGYIDPTVVLMELARNPTYSWRDVFGCRHITKVLAFLVSRNYMREEEIRTRLGGRFYRARITERGQRVVTEVNASLRGSLNSTPVTVSTE